MAEEEKKERVDNIIRPEKDSNDKSSKGNLSKEEIDKLISSISKPKDSTSYFEELANKFVSSINEQTTILENALNEISKQIKISRLQSLMKDKIVTDKGNVKEISPTGKTSRFVGKDKYNEMALLKSMKVGDKSDRQSFAKDKPMMVIIQDISPEAAAKIGGKTEVNVEKNEEDKTQKEGGALQKLLQFALGGLGLLAAVERLFKMSFTDGNFQGFGKMLLTFVSNGLLSIVGKMGKLIPKVLDNLKITPIVKELGTMFKRTIIRMFGKPGAKVINKVGISLGKIGKNIFGKSFLKRLPFIGGLFSLGVGLDRINKGDFVGGLTDLVSGILSVSVVGYPLALALDIFTAVGDVQEGRARKAGRVNWKMKMNEWFSNNARNLPLIGAGIRLGEGLGEIMNGNFIKGYTTIMGGMLSNVGVPQLLDWLSSKAEQNPESYVGKAFSLGGKLKEWILKRAKSLPLLGMGTRLADAFKKISSGNILGGFKDMVSVLGNGLGISPLIDLLSSKVDAASSIETPIGKFPLSEIISNFTETVVDFMKSIIFGGIEKAKETLSNIIPGSKKVIDMAFDAIGFGGKQELGKGERGIDSIRFKAPTTKEKVKEVYSNYSEKEIDRIVENNKDMIIEKNNQEVVESQKQNTGVINEVSKPKKQSIDEFKAIPQKIETPVPKPEMRKVEILEKTEKTTVMKQTGSDDNIEIQRENIEVLKNIERLLSESDKGLNFANSVSTSQVNNFMTGGSSVTSLREQHRRGRGI